ncbi:uncharacterized protein LOC115889324 [Sitophilus oryzae]|uniref:Uncharacterized protein LOC115889324 n=1 Tax=Sitophilus oryzae TaxID=7048 RepID=A0A6J2YMA0_SITOR|nr:uncharacterized protein LOC115889324 [Sitophilus oryzae]
MGFNNRFCVLAALTLCFFNEGSALQCYECTASDALSCGSPFNRNNVSVIDCSMSIFTVELGNDSENKVFTCLMIKETDTTTNGVIYNRRCSVKNSDDTCKRIIEENQKKPNIKTTCTECEKDLCNSTSNQFENFSIIALFISFAIFRI